MDAREVFADDLFNRVSEEVLSDPNWKLNETSEPDLRLYTLQLEHGDYLVRSEYVWPLSFETIETIFRCEVYFHPLRSQFDPRLESCRIEELLRPGAANVCMQYKWTKAALKQRLVLGDTTTSMREDPEMEEAVQGVRHAHFARRRDFPAEGDFSIILTPRCPETGILLNVDGSGSFFATTAFARRLPDDANSCHINETKRIPRAAIWAMSQYARAMAYPKEFLSVFSSQEFFQQLLESDDGYEVLTIRKCTKGPPLLPDKALTCGDMAELPFQKWVSSIGDSTQRDDFFLCDYLQKLQSIAEDVVPVPVFDVVDGRRLVAYQAAVRRGDWRKVWPRLEPGFRRQRAVYRHRFGGKCAPELSTSQNMRFAAMVRAEPEVRQERTDSGSSGEPHVALTVKGTFLHIPSPPPGLPQQRAATTLDIPNRAVKF